MLPSLSKSQEKINCFVKKCFNKTVIFPKSTDLKRNKTYFRILQVLSVINLTTYLPTNRKTMNQLCPTSCRIHKKMYNENYLNFKF